MYTMIVIFVDIKTFGTTPMIVIKTGFPGDGLTEVSRKRIHK